MLDENITIEELDFGENWNEDLTLMKEKLNYIVSKKIIFFIITL